MGLLDDLLWNVGPEMPALVGRRARKVLREGQPADATVAGILVERTTEDTVEPEYRYALDVRGGTGMTRVGVRQRLRRRAEVPVGAVVNVRVLGEKVVIVPSDGGDTVGTWKMVDAPAEGVEDRWRRGERKRIDGGTPARVTVLQMAQSRSAFGAVENVDLDVRLATDGGVDEVRRLERVLAPDYARSLVRTGAILPAGVDRDGTRVTIDWERAANGGAGFDPSPPAPPPPPVAAPPAPAPPAPDVSLETYVEVQVGMILDRVAPKDADAYAAGLGVPAGTWAQVDAAWKARTRTMEYGTAFGELFSTTMKQRKMERR